MRVVKVVGISVVRNEADIIGVTVAHHLSQGLDEILIVDNGSTDDTSEVLWRLAKKDRRVKPRRDESHFDQAALTTALAREAYRRGADWVLPFDAGEFWWTEGDDLKEVLADSEAGALRVLSVVFLQARGQRDSTPEGLLTMTRRPVETFPVRRQLRRLVESNKATVLQAADTRKCISRPTEDIDIGRGNHEVCGVRGEYAQCDAIVCLHAPLRSRAHLESKTEQTRRLTEAGKSPRRGAWHVWRWARMISEGKLDQEWAANSYEGGQFDVYGEKHAVIYDPRLRNAVAPHILGSPTVPRALERALTEAKWRAWGALASVRSAGPLGRELEATKRELRETARRLAQAEQQNKRRMRRNQKLSREFKRMARDYLLCSMAMRSVCAEIGVHEGDFSRHILDTVEPEKLHLIDPWRQGEGLFGKQAAHEQAIVEERYEQVRGRFAEEIRAGRVHIHRALSGEAADDFRDAYFDWVYVDGNHLYEFVKQDLELYYPKIKDGGYLAGDDYGNRGYWDNGVQKAVDEFVSLRPEAVLEVRAMQFIIRKGRTP